jgi:hypothetical protein
MLTVLTPAILPRVQVPIDVGDPDVVDVGAFAIVPPPAVTVTVTATPPRIFPLPSFTEKVGAVARPAVADGVVDEPVIELGTEGSVPLEQPRKVTAITAAIAGSDRTLIVLGICNCELKNHRQL